jgi:hypothetical protein
VFCLLGNYLKKSTLGGTPTRLKLFQHIKYTYMRLLMPNWG